MKSLIYLFALALVFSSCSVDSPNEDVSLLEQDLFTRAAETGDACASGILVNQKSEYRGTVEAFMDYVNNEIIIRFTLPDWKIQDSKLFFGPESEMNGGSPDLYLLGKYIYSESFEDDVYVANFVFNANNVESDFSLLAVLNVKNDIDIETVMIDGAASPDSKVTYAKEFVKDCIDKPVTK